ncbi:hypothetical protein [Microbulbifer sp. ALW1]|uniref:hypothetical protein n=1 Tax=Microbulbifer sp. (strain ALW1) TaxID=1516059 RepID=UPI001F39814F|nr:hypothetical protein [Microbulbifer sp. ALW1]
MPDLILTFLDHPGEKLDGSCLEDIHRPPFMVGAYGPALMPEPVVPEAESILAADDSADRHPTNTGEEQGPTGDMPVQGDQEVADK